MKLNYQKLTFQLTQNGVVALITSIIVGLLLLVITSSAIALMATELRQASDFDQSVKAYFAAESGVEDALAKIRRGLEAGVPLADLVSEDCDPYSLGDADLSGDNVVAYTCQMVDVETNQLTGTLRAEEALQIDLSGVDFQTPQTFIKVSWNQRRSSDPQSSDENIWKSADGQLIPSLFPSGAGAEGWSGRFPAVLEATLIDYPDRAAFESRDIGNRTIVLKPASSGFANPQININSFRNPESVKCVPEKFPQIGGYDCEARFIVPPSNANYILRLIPRYSQTNYKIEAFRGINPVPLADGQLIIDVTGKANDVFRRVRVQIPLGSQPSVNFVLLANETICKVLEVSDVRDAANSEFACP